MEVVLQWTESTDEHLRSYVNGIPTGSGGTHENGLRAGVGKAIRNYIETHNLTPKGVTLTAEDIREGVIGVLSVFVAEPQFQGQTKDRLNNPEVHSRDRLDGASGARAVAEQQQQRRRDDRRPHHPRGPRARGEPRPHSRRSRARRRPPRRLTLPGKLTDCSSNDRDRPSCSSSRATPPAAPPSRAAIATQQAILPLRGKVLNTESASLAKVLENKELADLVIALGCGLGKNFDLSRLRYGKIILLADADSDGHHITTLLLTFIYRHMPQLIDERPRLPRAAAALPHRHRQGDVLGRRRRRTRRHPAGSTARARRRAKPEITRFKGLGEMMPKVLWETTLNPKTRRLLRVEIADQLVHRPRDQRADGQGRVGALPLHHGTRGGGGGARSLSRARGQGWVPGAFRPG